MSMGMSLPSVKTIQDVQILGEKIATSGYNCGFLTFLAIKRNKEVKQNDNCI